MRIAFRFAVLVLCVTVVPTAIGFASAEYCTDNTWMKFRNNCYSFESFSSGLRLSYYDAEDYCRSKGAHLASIHSKDESNFLLNIVKNFYYSQRQWIGLNILDGNEEFKWSDGTSVDYKDIVEKKQYKREKCFILFPEKSGWRPEHCELRYTPICKKSVDDATVSPNLPVTTPSLGADCPKHWIQHGNKCYRYFGSKDDERKMFSNAKQHCTSMGEDYDLVSIHSSEEQAFLTQNLAGLNTSAWIGLSHVESDEIGHILVFGWTDNSRMNFTYWAPGHPMKGTWKNCVRLSYDDVGKGAWTSDYCSIGKYGYICETRTAPQYSPAYAQGGNTCKDESTPFRNACYTIHTNPKSWHEAEQTCQEHNGHLVSVTDGFEKAFLFNFVGRHSTWSGLRSIQGSKIFQWSDKQPLYYANWAQDQPLVNYEYEEKSACVFISGSGDHHWNATACDIRLPFVCKTVNGLQPVQRPVTLGECSNKISTLVDIGDKYCYDLGPRDFSISTWAGTVQYCFSRSMNLLTLSSEHQMKSLMAYVWQKPYDYWTGLIKVFKEDAFMWGDNSPMNYTNWAAREPQSGNADCAVFSTRDSKWYAKECSKFNGVICQGEKK